MNNNLASKYISDTNLSEMIQFNISFVEKHLDTIKPNYTDIREQHIVYRELGSIVFSCIEAIWKAVLVEINNRCEKNNCNKKNCSYRKYRTDNKINRANVKEVLDFIMNTRLFWYHPAKIEEIYNLIDLRNYIHISKNIAYEDKSPRFNKEYVESMLDLYYETLNQFELNEWYFKNDILCLKNLDEDGYKETQKLNQYAIKQYHSFKIIELYWDLFRGKELSESEITLLSKLKYDNLVDKKEIANFLKKVLEYDRNRYNNNLEKYNELSNRFNSIIDKYTGEYNFIEKYSK